MTDKEKLDKLVAEIKRLRKEVKDNIAELGNSESERIGLFKDLEIYDNILSLIDSMQEEPKDKRKGCKGCNNVKVAEKTFTYEEKHRTAMVLASECIRNHGWFGRERDFNELWGFIEGTDDYKTLFNGTNYNKKIKLLKAEENG